MTLDELIAKMREIAEDFNDRGDQGFTVLTTSPGAGISLLTTRGITAAVADITLWNNLITREEIR